MSPLLSLVLGQKKAWWYCERKGVVRRHDTSLTVEERGGKEEPGEPRFNHSQS